MPRHGLGDGVRTLDRWANPRPTGKPIALGIAARSDTTPVMATRATMVQPAVTAILRGAA